MNIIIPQWHAPKNVRAFTTTRDGGVSQGEFAGLNLADYVGDNPQHVAYNRQRLQQELHLPQAPFFLKQTHSTNVVTLPSTDNQADACYTQQAGQVCLVLTADCLPVLLTDKQGTQVAAAHAGWRGLCNGILEETVRQFKGERHDILAWLAPAIGVQSFRVGSEVRAQFLSADPQGESAFSPADEQGFYWLDMYAIARQRLQKMGVTAITNGHYDTFTDKAFYSYRRQKNTGRMASLIWFE